LITVERSNQLTNMDLKWSLKLLYRVRQIGP